MKIAMNSVKAGALVLMATTAIVSNNAYGGDTAKTSAELPKICQRSGLTCLAGERSLVIGPDGQVSFYTGLIENAEKRYAQSFKAPRVKTVLFLTPTVSEEDRDGLREAGYKVLLPWVSGAARQAMARNAIRAQVKSQNSEASEAEVETMTEAMLERAGLGMNIKVERGAISHEFAHMWFIQSNWPRSDHDQADSSDEDEEVSQYGSGAPDWLDEMAAVLSENDFLMEQRRETAKDIVAKGDLNAFWPLATYFTMEHPIYKKTLAMLKARGDLRDGMNVVMLTGAQARDLDADDGRESPHFYAQSRVFADFMIEMSNAPYIFDTIARALGAGTTMETWLSEQGQKHGLETTLPALQKQWEAWLIKI